MLLLLAATAAWGQNLAAAYELWLHPQLDRAAQITDAGFQWDGFRVLLLQGELAITPPRPGGGGTAAFVGRGAFQLQPAAAPDAAIERGQMIRYQGRSEISVVFSAAVFHFADSATFLRALGSGVVFTSPAVSKPAEKLLSERAKFVQASGVPLLARMLQATDRGGEEGLLLAELRLQDDRWLEIQFDPDADPRQDAAARVFSWAQASDGGGLLPEIWSAFTARPAAPTASAARLDHYAITATITDDLKLDARARFAIVDAQPGARGTLFRLDPGLRISHVATASGAALDWLQPEHAGWFYVRAPAVSAPEAQLEAGLEVAYRGPAPLYPGAADHEFSSAPGWYPALGADPLATLPPAKASFELTFTTDKRNRLLASGERLRETTLTDGANRTEWRSPSPMPAAGFALGRDEQAEKQLQLASGRRLDLRLGAPARDAAALQPLAGSKLVDALNYLGARFGPYPYAGANLALAGGEVSAAPAPMLVLFNPGSFLDLSPQLTEAEPVAAAAGQWWGAWTAPASVHDEWLLAGLRAASGLLYQESRYGPEASVATLRAWQDDLLRRSPASGHILADLGPLWLGAQRLSSSQDDGQVLLDAKGGYLIYMLRQMMFDPRSPTPDAAFDATLRDFAAQDGGRAASTADFQKAAERHMSAAMDLDGDHKLDWFFRPWVQGVAVPQISFAASIAPAAPSGPAQVSLRVENP
ncbi:MAG: hypothetical protein ACRD1E_07815, partial [Terriglobales bacterium]